MFNITCIAIRAVMPIAIRLPKLSFALIAISTPLTIKTVNSARTMAHPTNPSSSAKIANMKSLCASGMYKYF